jgi:6-pyruvoyltetrahydropterin/6-carboxytetrahydropterin synthase
MIYVCRNEEFCAAHKVYNPEWSQEKNEEVYGKCAFPNWHGHNFKMTVKVKGKPDEKSGYVLDMKLLGKLIKELILEQVDHKNLNEDVPFLRGKLTSCEVLVTEFWKILAPPVRELTGGRAELFCITLAETDKNFVEYFGEE